jgi:hypothetical protein
MKLNSDRSNVYVRRRSTLKQKIEVRKASSKEINDALARFEAEAERNRLLGLLFLADPVRAIFDSGAELSKPSRKLIRRTLPIDQLRADKLYEELLNEEDARFIRCIDVTLGRRRDN